MDCTLSSKQKRQKYQETFYEKKKKGKISKSHQKRKLNEKRFREFLYDDNAKLSDYIKKKSDL